MKSARNKGGKYFTFVKKAIRGAQYLAFSSTQ